MGFVVDKWALGQVFSEYFGFPCQFSFHRQLHIHYRLSSGAGTIGQLLADVPSGLSLTPPQETKKTTPYHNLGICKITSTLFYGHVANIFTVFLTRYGTRICRRKFELKRILCALCSDLTVKVLI
jgi:hypothetical protein